MDASIRATPVEQLNLEDLVELFILPDESSCAPLRDIDLAGRKPEAYLRANAARHFRVFSSDEAKRVSAAGLYVCPDAWFTSTALDRLADRLAAPSKTGTFVIAGNEAIAAYLSAQQSKMLAAKEAGPVADALGSLQPRLPDCVLIGADELDPDFPPLRMATLLDVARIEKHISLERAQALLLKGVRIRDPDRISIRGELACGEAVEIDIDAVIEGQVTLADGVRVGPHCILKNASIGRRSRVNAFSIVEDAVVGEDSFIGPFGRVRPGSVLGDRAQIGNFVEIKNAQLGYGARINHLAFVGDAVLGNEVTLGAGVITCNHDGQGTNTTQIGDGAYVGSGCELVAPVSIGAGAFIAAGSTITQDAPPGKLTLARARQLSVERRLRDKPGSKGA